VIASLITAAALAAGPNEFLASHPRAVRIEARGGGQLVHASGFEASGLGDSPEEAARAFLDRYGAAFGVAPEQRLVVRARPGAGLAGPVRFERLIGGLPVFGGEVVVSVNAANAVFLVNAADVPPRSSGRFALGRRAAIRAAKASLGEGAELAGPPAAGRGWQPVAESLRPAWRLDLALTKPAGEWRVYVDAETGEVILRMDRRRTAAPAVPPKGGALLEPPGPRR
jgi:Zn-dependent metalloprotease